MSSVHILSGGAAQGLVQQLRGTFYNETGRAIEGHFGAVSLMRDKLLAGEPCDVLILTEPLIDELTVAGRVQPGSVRALGRVRTGLAVRAGDTPLAVDTPEALKAALLAAQGIYCPDLHKATAGIHLMGVLQRLGLAQTLQSRLRPCASGTAAMHELAAASGSGLIGCAQVTEIRSTPGVQFAGVLPKEFESATFYAAAIASRAEQPQAARLLIDMLAAPDTVPLRRAGGFE